MTKSRYQVGDILALRKEGNRVGTIKVVDVYHDEDGKIQVVYEVIELLDKKEPVKVGTRFKCAEDEFVGTFENPLEPSTD